MKKRLLFLFLTFFVFLSGCTAEQNDTSSSATPSNSSIQSTDSSSDILTSNLSSALSSTQQVSGASSKKTSRIVSSASPTIPKPQNSKVTLAGSDGRIHVDNMVYDGLYRYSSDFKTKQPFQMVPKDKGFSPFSLCKVGDRFYFTFSANTHNPSFRMGSCNMKGGNFKDLGEADVYGTIYNNSYFYDIHRVFVGSGTNLHQDYYLRRRNIDGTTLKDIGKITTDGLIENTQLVFKISDGFAFLAVSFKNNSAYITQILRISLSDAKTTIVKAFNADATDSSYNCKKPFIVSAGYVYLANGKDMLKIKTDGSSVNTLYSFSTTPLRLSWALDDEKMYLSFPCKLISVPLDGDSSKVVWQYDKDGENTLFEISSIDNTWVYLLSTKTLGESPFPRYRIKKDGTSRESINY